AWVVLALADKRYRPQFSWTLVLFGAFSLWMFIADLFGVNAHKALWSNFERMDGFVTLIHVFGFFLVAGTLLSVDKLWKRWWQTFIGVSALVCGYSVLQLMGGAEIHQGGVRVDATFGNAIYLAVYLMFAAFVTVWLALESREKWARYSLFALAALQVVILFNTATRGAIVAITAGALFAAFLWLLETGKQGRKAAAGALVGLLVLVGGFWLIRDASFVRESPIFSRVASISLAELKVRFTLWDMAREGVMERPLVGYGQEGFNYVFNEYYRPELYGQEPWFDRAHNAYVDWLVAGGIPAGLLFLLLLGSGFLALYRDRRASPALRILFLGALGAYAVQAIVVFDNLFSYIPVAAILAMAHHASSRPIRALEALPEVRRGNGSAVIAPIAIVVALLLIWSVNLRNMNAANALVYAISPLAGSPAENLEYFKEALGEDAFATQEMREQLISYASNVIRNPNAPNALKTEFATLAVEEMKKEVARAPEDARLRLQLSLAYRMVGAHDQALAELDAALALSPSRQMFLLEKGNTLQEIGRTTEMREAFYAAYALSPEFPQLAAYAAAADIYAGDVASAKALLLDVYGTTTVAEAPLVRAYYEMKHYDELIDTLRLEVANANGEPQAVIRLASAYALADRFAEARTELMQLLKTHPEATAVVQRMLASLPAGQ
ncbi:MAG TPA: O-antigen ligase family protein, partial [Candidatus Paceibacterota bacterium]|nr:O-antigen ligase family protein [Candidatus Paceibacterota bacterium]